jgi:UDP:flavonoid glycosyltransferase YjiC (YdhE family)
MRVLFATSPLVGHVNPMRVAAGILKEAGHTIAVYTGTEFRDKIEAAGVRFFPLPTEVDHSPQDVATMLGRLAPGPQRRLATIKALFIDALPAQFTGLQKALETFDADLIVYESAFLGMLPLLLGSPSARPVCAYLGISTCLLPREDGAPFGPGLPPATDPAQREQYELIARNVEAAVGHPLMDETDRRLVEVGASKLPAPIFESMTALADLILQPCVPGFEFRLRDPPEKMHFIGALVPKGAGELPNDLRAAKLAGRRVVLVSQGTIANRDLGQLLAPALPNMRTNPRTQPGSSGRVAESI